MRTTRNELRSFCPYCGGTVTEYIRNGDLGGKLYYWYCDDCRQRLYPEDLITAQEAAGLRG